MQKVVCVCAQSVVVVVVVVRPGLCVVRCALCVVCCVRVCARKSLFSLFSFQFSAVLWGCCCCVVVLLCCCCCLLFVLCCEPTLTILSFLPIFTIFFHFQEVFFENILQSRVVDCLLIFEGS